MYISPEYNVDKTLNMDPIDCESLITDKTKVILPVHMLGIPADMDKIMQIADKYKLKVLEDNCESVGAKYKEKYLGTIGNVGVFSFDFGKNITTGEGGAVLTNDPAIDEKVRLLRTHGSTQMTELIEKDDGPWYYEMTDLGYNYRLTDFQCALGMSQLKKLNTFLLFLFHDPMFHIYNN